jgi:hypothetical protein
LREVQRELEILGLFSVSFVMDMKVPNLTDGFGKLFEKFRYFQTVLNEMEVRWMKKIFVKLVGNEFVVSLN